MMERWPLVKAQLCIFKIKLYLSITDTPKSGEVELQMAPRLAVANMASTASAQLGM